MARRVKGHQIAGTYVRADNVDPDVASTPS